jgi:outer membrane immunogenic protein
VSSIKGVAAVRKLPLVASVAFAVLPFAGIDDAAAQSAAPPTDAQRLQQLEQDNSSMRARIRRLELENENATLRARLDQLEGRASPAQRLQPGTVAAAASRPGLQDYAADLPLKAPAFPAIYSWTGFYVGANIGYSVGNDRANGSLAVAGAPPITDSSAFTSAVAPNGPIGGGQLGYNWQGGSSWLVGFEADFQGSSQTSRACIITCEFINQPPTLGTQILLSVQHEVDYFGTFRPRIGLVNNDALFYVTGGAAYGHVRQTDKAIFDNGSTATEPATFTTGSFGDNKFGWVVGGGIEAALWGNWTGKIEYLYMSLGSISSSISGTVPNGVPTPPTPFTLTAASTIRDNIVRAGVNYRFGGAPAVTAYDRAGPGPVPVTSMPIYAWTGFYVGTNVGYSSGNDRIAQTFSASGGGITANGFSGEDSVLTPNGVLGGAQVGYNWQGGRNWLIGFEADFQGSDQKDSACTPLICFNQTNGGTTAINALTIDQHLEYFATLRGRVGVVNNGILFYATGGAAFGHLTEDLSAISTLSMPSVFLSSSTAADLTGWTAGGGIEAALFGNWTGKVEYLYMDLGNVSNTLNVVSAGITEPIITTSTVRDHIFRAGVNYRFSSEPAVVSRAY